MPTDYVPRLSVELSPELYERLKNTVQWGLLKPIMNILVEDFLDLIDTHGEIVIALVLKRTIKTQHIIKELRKESVDGTERHKEEPV
jgi:hypothetical protein